ncbi:MAG: choice-of-anchor J domain-containing protein [Muribaculaceae bacterium]|nr:choice-of-anchor J domain-containing protein [Muribaculaceae bacterium]
MNKKLFFSFVLMVMAAILPARAAELTVYEGTVTNNHIPAYMYYWDDFTRSQTVIPAADLEEMNGGTISAITFYTTTQNVPYTSLAEADVYLMEVDYTAISAFEPKANATMVYQGIVDVVSVDENGGTMTITFATPYTYNGGNLLIGIENTSDAQYKNIYFYGQTVNGASVSGSNGTSLDNVTASQQNFIPKTTFTYTPGEGPVYYKPTNLVVSDIATNSAKLTWTPGSTETAWNVEYKKAADEDWTSETVTGTPELTLDALENNTNYEVRVQADYGEGNLSSWVNATFTTLKCDDIGYITYTLTDSYGDGWNGAAINVIDAATGETVQTLTLSSGSSATGTVGICYGETYNFVWVAGSYPSECSFTLTDPFGDVIYECAAGGAPAAGQFASYTYVEILNPMPKNLAVSEITQTTAQVTWTGEAEAYNLRYRVKADTEKFYQEGFENGIGGWTVVDNDGDGDNWALMKMTDYNMGGTPMTAADGDYALASCSIDDNSNYIACDNWAISPQVDLKGTLKFFVSDLGASYVENFSVYVSTTGTDVADFTALAENIATPGGLNNWEAQSFDLSAYEGQQGYIAIRHQSSGTGGYYLFLDAISINGSDIPAGEWIVIENASTPEVLEGLTSNTNYEVQVQAVYAEDTSDWTESVDFTTLSMNVAPAGLEIAEVTATTATAEWEGIQDAYNLRYRKAAAPLNQINEDFETMTTGSNPPEGWTMIDADGDGNCWYGWAPASVTDNSGNPVVNGACGITSASYASDALTPDNWLITPRVNLGGTLSFQYRGQDPSYAAEHFAVYVSTGDPTNPESFVQVGEETVAGTTLAEFTADLSEYDGQVGYIAIRHFNCTDQFRLNIDDFVYNYNNEENVPVGEWTTVENVTSPYTIEGLDPETEYEAQVQGVYPDGAKAITNWTESVFFTTTAPEPEDGFFLVGSFNEWNQTAEGGRLAFDENDKIEGVELQAGAEFKVIAFDENGTIWFGGQDDNNAGFFLLNSDLMGVGIMTVQGDNGANFRIEEAGTYTIQLAVLRDFNGAVVMTVTKEDPSAISTIGVDGYDNNAWYNLNGQKLNGKPVVPGIYINGHKKVVIK